MGNRLTEPAGAGLRFQAAMPAITLPKTKEARLISQTRLDLAASRSVIGATWKLSAAIHVSSRFRSPADCQRSSGSFSRHVLMVRSNSGGDVGSISEMGRGLALMMAVMRLAWLAPSKAFFPVNIS